MRTYVRAIGSARRMLAKGVERKMDTNALDATAVAATRARIYEALRDVYDPELGVNVVDLGLVYDVRIRADGHVTVTMTLTTPGCPMHESLGEGVAQALAAVPGVTGGEVELVWDPPWDPAMMTTEGKVQLGWPT